MNQFFVYISLHLNEFRENLAVPGTLLLSLSKSAYRWCSRSLFPTRLYHLHPCKRTIGTPHRRDAGRTIPVGDLDQSPLILRSLRAIRGLK